MVKPGWITEREELPDVRDVEATPPPQGEEGRLLAAALTAALLEYRRQLTRPEDEAQAAEPAVEWRVLGRWEQMAPSLQGRRQG